MSSTRALPGQATLLRSWRALATISDGAGLVDTHAAAAAVFPAWAPLNNAIVLAGADVSTAAADARRIFADAGVDEWALWIPTDLVDLDAPDRIAEVEGLKRDMSTLVMQAAIPPTHRAHDGVVRASIAVTAQLGERDFGADDLGEPEDVPGFSAWAMVADGVAVSALWALLDGSECGVYAVETLPAWRRRGMARRLMEHVLADAYQLGARTCTLQSTRMGQPLYESLGFEPVGRYDEWVPQ